MSRRTSGTLLGVVVALALAACSGDEIGLEDRGGAAPDVSPETTPAQVPPPPGDSVPPSP